MNDASDIRSVELTPCRHRWRAFFPEIYSPEWPDASVMLNLQQSDSTDISPLFLAGKLCFLAYYLLTIAVAAYKSYIYRPAGMTGRAFAVAFWVLISHQVPLLAITQALLWLVVAWRCYRQGGQDQVTCLQRVFCTLHENSFCLEATLTIFYWPMVFDPRFTDVSSYMLHGGMFMVLAIDWFISSHPYHLASVKWALLYGLCYCLQAYLFTRLGGIGLRGDPYVYKGLSFEGPETLPVILGTNVLIVICHLTCWGYVRLRDFIYSELTI